jgi:hypothetical protein
MSSPKSTNSHNSVNSVLTPMNLNGEQSTMSLTLKQRIQNSLSEIKIVEGFDKSFNNGFCWAVQSGSDDINVEMIYMYYTSLRTNCIWYHDDDFSNIEDNGENDERILKLFVPKKLWCKSGDDSCIYALGFMRGVVAGVEQRFLIAEVREQYYRGIREYARLVSRAFVDSRKDCAAPLGETATEAPRFDGRGSQPAVLQ